MEDQAGAPQEHFVGKPNKINAETKCSGKTMLDLAADVRETRQVEDAKRTPKYVRNDEDRDSRGTIFGVPTLSPIVPRRNHGGEAEPLVLDSPLTAIDLTSPPNGTNPSAESRGSASTTIQHRSASPSPPKSGNECNMSEDDHSMANGSFDYNDSAPSIGESGEETAEEKRTREQEESEALARQLMAEEAMASYNMSTNFLRDNANEYSEEDLAALEAAMAEEDPMANVEEEAEEGEVSGELSYDTMLRISERIGDVKQERWQIIANDHIGKLPTMKFEVSFAEGKDENDSAVKCLVCQCPYETDETLRRLPCGHCFHIDCVDQWLSSKDVCPYCRQSILQERK